MTRNLWSSRLIILSLGLAVVLTGCNPRESLVSLKPDSGDKKYSGNISDQDVNRFLASVKKVDGAVEARYKMARYFQKRNRHKVAIVELKDIIQRVATV